jgi:hypothetical protein
MPYCGRTFRRLIYIDVTKYTCLRCVKVRRDSLSLAVKLNVIRRSETGEHQLVVCRVLDFAGSAVRSIFKNRDKVKECGSIATPLGT